MLGTRKGASPAQNKGHGVIEQSMFGLASVLATIAALLASGWIHQFTAAYVYGLLLSSYGDVDMATLGMYLWDLLATAAVFFITRAIIVLAMMIIATRLLVHFI
jgi:hypothetical protein